MDLDKEGAPWRIIYPDAVRERAMVRIFELYPLGLGRDAARLDILGWYRRWVAELEMDPFKALGAPPMKTDSPSIARFPADESLPVSAIANVNRADRVIVIIEIHIRPTKGGAR